MACRLDILINWFWMPLGSDFLNIFPHLSRLSIRSLKQRDLRLKYKFGDSDTPYENHLRLPKLRSLVLENVRITADADIPILSGLQTLRLCNVAWESRSYYLLLRGARRSLRSIEMDDFLYEPAGDLWEDYQDFLDIRDPDFLDGSPSPSLPPPAIEWEPDVPLPDPIPIIFPELRYMRLTGITPPIFAPSRNFDEDYDAIEPPTPLLVMPVLQECVLRNTQLDTAEDVPADQEQLTALGELAPNLRSLTLSGVMHEDSGLHACLDAMHRSLVRLDLSGSTFTDWIICRLPYLTPHLRELDVRGCTDIGSQSVARAVEMIRDQWEEGESRLERVWLDETEMVDPRDQWAEHRAYEWLAFVGVLQLDDRDLEGLGPSDPRQRRMWIKIGKRDVQHDQKVKYLEWEKRQLAQRLLAVATAASTGTSSASGAAAVSPLLAKVAPLLSASGVAAASSLIARVPLSLMGAEAFAAAAQAAMAPQSGKVTPAAAPATTVAGQQAPSALPAMSQAATLGQPAPASATPVSVPFGPQPSATPALPGAPAQGYGPISCPHPPVTPARPPLSSRPPPTVPKARLPPTPPTPAPATAPSTDFDVSDVNPQFLAAQIKEMERIEAAQAQRVQAQIDAAEQAAAQVQQVRRRAATTATDVEDEPMLVYDEAVPAINPEGATTDDEPVVDILASDDDSQRSTSREAEYAKRTGFAANTDDEAEDPPTDGDRDEAAMSTGANTPAAIDSPADLFVPLL